jgi:RES domain-containing protein
MIAHRLSSPKYAQTLDGEGAKVNSGRWNFRGHPLVYCSESRAMCVLEILARSQEQDIQKKSMVTLELPEDSVCDCPLPLPDGWDCHPFGIATQEIGRQFIAEKQHLALRVPSSLVAGDFNIVINPMHPSISKVKIIDVVDFEFGPRLV